MRLRLPHEPPFHHARGRYPMFLRELHGTRPRSASSRFLGVEGFLLLVKNHEEVPLDRIPMMLAFHQGQVFWAPECRETESQVDLVRSIVGRLQFSVCDLEVLDVRSFARTAGGLGARIPQASVQQHLLTTEADRPFLWALEVGEFSDGHQPVTDRQRYESIHRPKTMRKIHPTMLHPTRPAITEYLPHLH